MMLKEFCNLSVLFFSGNIKTWEKKLSNPACLLSRLLCHGNSYRALPCACCLSSNTTQNPAQFLDIFSFPATLKTEQFRSSLHADNPTASDPDMICRRKSSDSNQ
jgi:hypothetical protein